MTTIELVIWTIICMGLGIATAFIFDPCKKCPIKKECERAVKNGELLLCGNKMNNTEPVK